MAPASRTAAAVAVVAVVSLLTQQALGHEYLGVPLARTADCLLNGVIMGGSICQTITKGDDQQCEGDRLFASHLFHVHPAYGANACGGSLKVSGKSGGSQGLLQRCGDSGSDPALFNMSLPQPNVSTFLAGAEAELTVKGFFHQGVMRLAMCFPEDGTDCSAPGDFTKYVLGFHFTEGTAGNESSPKGIYSVVMPFKVKFPNRNGEAVLQWLVDAEDVRSYVSCTTIKLTGATAEADTDSWTCNGHPLCNCTTHTAPAIGSVGLGLTCPQGTAPSVDPSGHDSTGMGIVEEYKAQLGVKAFCDLCITNGCPSTCGGIYNGFYQGPKCTNTPIIAGCDDAHHTGLPQWVDCTESSCSSAGWAPSPTPPKPSPPSPPSPPIPPTPPGPLPPPPPGKRKHCDGNACKSGWVYETDACPIFRPAVTCWNSDNHYKCCGKAM